MPLNFRTRFIDLGKRLMMTVVFASALALLALGGCASRQAMQPAPLERIEAVRQSAWIVNEQFEAIEACYAHTNAAKKRDKVKLTVRYTIAPGGEMVAMRVIGDQPEPALEECLTGVFERLRFPAHHGDSLVLEYPIEFRAPKKPQAIPSPDKEPTPRSVAEVINAKIHEIQSCYEKALLKDPTIGGKITIRFTIDENGKVPHAKAILNDLTPEVEQCISDFYKTLTFSPALDEGGLTVEYPFLFTATAPSNFKQKTRTVKREFPGKYILYKRFGIDISKEPMLIYPTLHYQNGGLAFNEQTKTNIPGLMIAGEVSGGIHGANRLMGNSLLDIVVFGRIAGHAASEFIKGDYKDGALSLDHVRAYHKELDESGIETARVAPALIPDYVEDHTKERQLTTKYLGNVR